MRLRVRRFGPPCQQARQMRAPQPINEDSAACAFRVPPKGGTPDQSPEGLTKLLGRPGAPIRMRASPVRRCARSRRSYANVRVVLREFYVDDVGVPRAQAAQFLANGTGIVWVIEPYLALTISRPPAIPAGIPAGDPRIGSGSKCDAVRHYALVFFLPRQNSQHWPIPNRRHRTRSRPKKDTALKGC